MSGKSEKKIPIDKFIQNEFRKSNAYAGQPFFLSQERSRENMEIGTSS